MASDITDLKIDVFLNDKLKHLCAGVPLVSGCCQSAGSRRNRRTISMRIIIVDFANRVPYCKVDRLCGRSKGPLWLRGNRNLTENRDLRLWIQSPAAYPSNFSTPDCKKNQLGTLHCNQRLLWRDFYKGVDRALDKYKMNLKMSPMVWSLLGHLEVPS